VGCSSTRTTFGGYVVLYIKETLVFLEVFMPCIEMQELEASSNRLNDLSLVNMSLLTAGRDEVSKWHRAGRARLAYNMQMHRASCQLCREQK
jgi:hypothetical protein